MNTSDDLIIEMMKKIERLDERVKNHNDRMVKDLEEIKDTASERDKRLVRVERSQWTQRGWVAGIAFVVSLITGEGFKI